MNRGQNEQIKSGMVALVGPPNVGKSTLLNRLLGQKISIVSSKPQTTRNRILGIVNEPGSQIVFMDTPGLHKARSPLNLEMVRIALQTLAEVDAVVFMIDASFPPPSPGHAPTEVLAGSGQPAILLINKIDLVPKEKLLPLMEAYARLHPFAAIVPVSALHGDGTERLLAELLPLLPEGPRLYPEDIPTDCTERFIVAEMIREKIFELIREEVPYSTAVTVDSFKDDPERRLTTIHATIFIEKQSQKGILIGRGGSMLRKIGEAARLDIEGLLDQKVLLKLWIKVQKNWTQDARFLRELGF